MILSGLVDEEDTEALDPLSQGAAGPPPVIGGGCSARFDPCYLTDESGVDYMISDNEE